ncbi:MAG: hypothetical protein K9K67_10600 [Bacteriovoracaceae bacterium]|nr:hypothetical protein [Bacteriovoracaceae bacterium]
MKIISLLLLMSSLCAEPTRIYFDVVKGELSKLDPQSPLLQGTIEAKDVIIDFGAEKLEFENPGEKNITAGLEWNELNYRLSVKKEGLKFSLPIAEGFGIKGIQNIGLKAAKVDLDKAGISMKGEGLSFQHLDFFASFKKAHIFCPTHGVFTSAIDVACLKESQANVGIISFQKRAIDADFMDARSLIDADSFTLMAHKAQFNDKNETTEVNDFQMNCSKLETGTKEVDPYSLLQGCLIDGELKIQNMDIEHAFRDVLEEVWSEFIKKRPDLKDQKSLIDLDHLRDINLKLEEGKLFLTAKVKAIFWIKIKIIGDVVLDIKNSELLFRVKRATIWGIPTGRLAYRLIEKFGRSDYIEIRGDLIVLKI